MKVFFFLRVLTMQSNTLIILVQPVSGRSVSQWLPRCSGEMRVHSNERHQSMILRILEHAFERDGGTAGLF